MAPCLLSLRGEGRRGCLALLSLLAAAAHSAPAHPGRSIARLLRHWRCARLPSLLMRLFIRALLAPPLPLQPTAIALTEALEISTQHTHTHEEEEGDGEHRACLLVGAMAAVLVRQ